MTDIAAIPLTRIDGGSDSLAEHKGNVLLVVNVASKCGLTPQYEGLEKLYTEYKDKGFEVLGFPANDFGAQEPGTHEEIMEFCSVNYGVSFPLFAKADVTGEGKQPLYAALTEAKPEKVGPAAEFRERLKGYGMTPTEDPEVLWNFEKFLIARDGTVAGRFAPGVEPGASELVDAIETELAK
ncbi:glutathione peroxidase [Novosphingobium mangrovi (ex Huang et al. 2023)]|uniref:Glutathione peroxidase n=1 Tax=Novosphingobium mangrovi (ex Huang et al. 2023) TaxID=2976432 RepID=A0ABT2I2S5_9SPHN|nr:glutathione peroxidase [Novosphingobium mangrovi (ex Huang et al. 2023)]MCT2399105.1 glutathione peroxidase [Novosphingobium mangrovi (ex Huang et al. 2023)]